MLPCLRPWTIAGVPFEELPIVEQAKDMSQVVVCKHVLEIYVQNRPRIPHVLGGITSCWVHLQANEGESRGSFRTSFGRTSARSTSIAAVREA